MRTPLQRWMVALALLGALGAAAPASGAAEDAATKEAREHLAKAKVHYKLREFDLAVLEFRAAYRLKPVAPLLFNIAQAERMNGNYKESKFYYEQYLRDVPDAPNKVEVKKQLAELAKLLADAEQAAAAAPPKAALPPEPKTVVVTPAPAAPEPAASALKGARPITAPVEGPQPIEKTPDFDTSDPYSRPVRPAEELVVVPPAAPPVPARATLAPTVRSAPPSPKWPWVLLGVAVVAGGAGGYFGNTARVSHDGAKNAVFQDDASRLATEAKSTAFTANVLFGVAGAAAAVGTVGIVAW